MGVGRGARPPAAGGPEEARRLRGGGGIRVRGGSARSGVRRHAPPLAVSRRLGIFYLKKKKVSRVLAEAGRQCLRVREPFPGQRAGLGHAPAMDRAASGAGGSNPGAANSSALWLSLRLACLSFLLCEMGRTFRPADSAGMLGRDRVQMSC